jgi:hypothetical protein
MEEQSDIDIRVIARFGLWLAIAAAVIHVALYGLFVFYEVRARAADPEPVSLIAPSRKGDRLPPGPRLQMSPARDMRRMRVEETKALGGYGWVDRQAGVVYMPVDRAIEILAEREGKK